MASLATRIGLADHGRKMTMEEFLEAEGDPGYRYELAQAIWEVTHGPSNPHSQVVWN